MRNPFKTSPRTKAERKRAKTNRDWSAGNKARRKKNMQRQLLQSMQKSPWTGVAGGLLAGAAGLLAFFAMQSAAERRDAGRTGFQLTSDPLTAPRYDRQRAFGWF